MPLLRFRILTLMIVVAVVAIECALFVTMPVAGLFILGPILGAALCGRISRDYETGHVVGGVAGGLVATLLFIISMEVFATMIGRRGGQDVLVYLLMPVAGLVAGVLIGWVFNVSTALRSRIDRKPPADDPASGITWLSPE